MNLGWGDFLLSSKKNEAIPIRSAAKGEVEHFYRIMELPLKPGDTFRGYQTERVDVLDGRVICRATLDKPNLFEHAQSLMVDLMDPRNNVSTAPASEFA